MPSPAATATPVRDLRSGLYLLTPDERDTARLLDRVGAVIDQASLLQYRNKLADAALARAQVAALLTGLAGVALICSPLETDWSAPGAFMGAGFLLIAALAWSAVILLRSGFFFGAALRLATFSLTWPS